MPDRRLSRVLTVLVAVVLSWTAARAASVDEEAKRLGDLAYYVGELDRGWAPLIDEYQRTISQLRDDPSGGSRPESALRPLMIQRDDVVWKRAEALFATGDESHEERCLELYTILMNEAVDDAQRASSRQRVADLAIRRGERFEAEQRYDLALEAYIQAVEAARGYERGYEKVGALGLIEADRLVEQQDFDAALLKLDQVLRLIEQGLPQGHASIGAVRGRRDAILSSTGTLALRRIGDAARLANVRGDRTDFLDATVRLEPLDGGSALPDIALPADRRESRRVRAARYRATVTGAGGNASVRTEVEITRDGGTVTVPVAIPDGMVWVPAAGGAPSFLCDRTEVSNEEYQRFAAGEGGRSTGGPANHPAAGVPFEDAQRYARWAGKDLPTLAQWTHAAFGAPGASSPRYPWGDQAGTPGVEFFGGQREPGPVDGCPAGASPSGVLNMAGNVFEWLADGWFIGGGYSASKFGGRQTYANPVDGQSSWEADFLRDKVPTPAIYEDLPPDLKNRHNVYRVTPEQATGFLKQVGFRCVIPLE